MPNGPARRPIAELQPGELIEDQVFLVHDKDLRTTTNGSAYIHAVLADSTGQMVARKWDASQALFDEIPKGGFLRFRGRVESYKGRPQFIIDGVRAVDPDAFDPSDFLPATTHDVEQMWTRLKEILRTIRHPQLLALVGKFINDEQFALAFKRSPAAAALHHAYLGGLLEHTLGVLELATLVLPRYPDLNADLVLAGIFFHDAGKTAELSYETNFGYTTEGQLIGHIVMAVSWLDRAARELEAESGEAFPTDLLNVLKHIVVSHHGTYEFGSPKLPALPEAVAVHYLDNLDAKLAMMRAYIDANNDDASEWTAYIPALQTKLLKTRIPPA